MTEHTLEPSTAGVRCSCGTWTFDTAPTTAVTKIKRVHAEHVQEEADWDAIETALSCSVIVSLHGPALEALARLRGRP